MPPSSSTEIEFARELDLVRPGLSAAYAARSPAPGAVLSRLWRALAHEPCRGSAPGADGRRLLLHLTTGAGCTGRPPTRTRPRVCDRGAPGGTGARLSGRAGHGARCPTATRSPPNSTSTASLALSGQTSRRTCRNGERWEWEHGWSTGTRTSELRSRPGFSVADSSPTDPSTGAGTPRSDALDDGGIVRGVWQVAAGRRAPPGPGPSLADGSRTRGACAGGAGRASADVPADPGPADGGPHVKTALSARLRPRCGTSRCSPSKRRSPSPTSWRRWRRAPTACCTSPALSGRSARTPPISRRWCASRPRRGPTPRPATGGARRRSAAHRPALVRRLVRGVHRLVLTVGLRCWTWGSPWRRTARTCWSCSRPRAPRDGWSIATRRHPGEPAGWPGTASSPRTWRAGWSRRRDDLAPQTVRIPGGGRAGLDRGVGGGAAGRTGAGRAGSAGTADWRRCREPLPTKA